MTGVPAPVQMKLQRLLGEMQDSFKKGMKVCFTARMPDNPEADLWMGDDTFEGVHELLQRRARAALGLPPPEAANAQILTCVYCGIEYPNGTPAAKHKILTDHIAQCDKHPMKKLTEDNAKLRAALGGFIGSDKLDVLEAIRAKILSNTENEFEEDAILSVRAIEALIETHPESSRESAKTD